MDFRKLSECVCCEKMVCTRKSPVPPTGKRSPAIVVVGQAPGLEENEAGEPFVGCAGTLLKVLLKIIADVDSEDIYFTNAVKCYPGKANKGDRKPRKSEIVNCASRWLHQELEELQPKFVLVLGQVALDAVAGWKSLQLKDVHGRVLQDDLDVELKGKVMPIYHPSVYGAERALKFANDLVAFREAVAPPGAMQSD